MAVVEVATDAVAGLDEVLEVYGLDTAGVVLGVLGVVTVAVLTPPPTEVEAGAGALPDNADAETWTSSSAAPTAATDAARTRVLRLDADMSGTPSGRLPGT